MMNYYDALIQHRLQVADTERHQEQARHLRDSKRAYNKKAEIVDETDTPDQPSTITRIVIDLKAAFHTLRPSDKPTCTELAKDAR